MASSRSLQRLLHPRPLRIRPNNITNQPYLARSLSSTRPSQGPTANNESHPPPFNTVDPSQVSHFASLASSWWDPHGPSRLLHLMNPLRHRFIERCLSGQADASSALTSPSTRSLNYLDVGCGGGIFAESAARLSHTASVRALDPTPEVLAVAQAHLRRDPVLLESGRLQYENVSIEQFKQDQKTSGYDIVTIFEVIEHVPSPADFLKHLSAHVKPGGWLIVSTIARTWPSWAVTKFMAEEVLRMVPRGTHDWDKYIHEKELRGWFAKENGLGVAEWDVAGARCMGVLYVPGLGWKEVSGSEKWGNYFFGIRRQKPSRSDQ